MLFKWRIHINEKTLGSYGIKCVSFKQSNTFVITLTKRFHMIDWDVKQTNKQTNKPSQWFPVYPSRHLHSAEVVVPTRVHIPPYLQGLGSHADISVIEIKGLTIQIY